MNKIDYEEYDFNVKGIIEVNSPESVVSFEISDIKKRLYGIAAVNKLLELGKNVTKTVKGDPILEQLIQKIPGKIEIISAKAIK